MDDIWVKTDFLEDSILDKIDSYIDQAVLQSSTGWYTSLSWPDEVQPSQGTVSILPIPQFAPTIRSRLLELRPDLSSFPIMVQAYIWHPGSDIPWHDDGNKGFGATLYLNKEWDENWGGLFLFEDQAIGIRGISPNYNTLVVNKSHVRHHVSMISPACEGFRKSLQIWGVREQKAIGL